MTDLHLCQACGYHVALDGSVMKVTNDLDDHEYWCDIAHCIEDNRLRLSQSQIKKAIQWYLYDIGLETIATYFHVTMKVLKINMRLHND